MRTHSERQKGWLDQQKVVGYSDEALLTNGWLGKAMNGGTAGAHNGARIDVQHRDSGQQQQQQPHVGKLLGRTLSTMLLRKRANFISKIDL